MYIITKSQWYTSETNIILYTNYIPIFKNYFVTLLGRLKLRIDDLTRVFKMWSLTITIHTTTEVQILKIHPKLTESETLGMGISHLF